jgi:hypothetical protein
LCALSPFALLSADEKHAAKKKAALAAINGDGHH